MNISKNVIRRLQKDVQDSLVELMEKIEAGKVLCFNDVGLLGANPSSLPTKIMAEIVGVTTKTMAAYVNDGCPKNHDGTFNSKLVIAWLIKREEERHKESDDLDEQKKIAEIAYKEAQTQKIKNEFMQRTDHDMIMASRAGSLRAFLENTTLNNAHHFVNLNGDEARTRLYELGRQMMLAYTGSADDG